MLILRVRLEGVICVMWVGAIWVLVGARSVALWWLLLWFSPLSSPPEYALVAPTQFGPLQASEYDGANLCLIVWVSADLGLISRFYVCIHAYMYICIRAQLKNKSFEREQ